MGCDTQFDRDDTPYIPPKKVALADKTRQQTRSGMIHTPMEAGEVVQYAIDYVRYTGDYAHKGDPLNSHLEPVRQITESRYETEEEFVTEKSLQWKTVSRAKEFPVSVMRRTVVYGPWETVLA